MTYLHHRFLLKWISMKVIKFYLCVCLCISTSTLAQSLPTEYFSRLPAFDYVKLSPSGNKLAFIQNTNLQGGTTILLTYDFATRSQRIVVSSDNVKVKINWFEWANDDILLVSGRYETKRNGGRFYRTSLLKVDLTQKQLELKRVMRKRKQGMGLVKNNHVSQFQDDVIDFLPNDPKHILVQIDYDKFATPSVYKVNVYTAQITRIEKAKLNVRHWITDQQNVVRVGYARDYDISTVKYYYRTTADDTFDVLFEYDLYEDKSFSVMGFGLDPNIMYYKKYNGDYKAVYKMDLTTRESTLVLANDGYDVDGSLIYSSKTNDVIGVSNPHSKFGRYYFNDSSYALVRGLKQAFNDKKVRVVSTNQDENRYIALVQSDNSAPQIYFGDIKQKRTEKLFSQYPELDNANLPHHKKVTYEARDGTEIEAYLTLPTFGEAPYPTVVHPHGGPGTRDYSGFDPWIAYMTSRGYAVIRPNFRGSRGYGYDFAQAQMQRWGLEMQDDLADAAHWMIEEKIADASKLCIFGASYGGYAAKMATVKTPDLFTCAVSFAGISDLYRLFLDKRKFLGGELRAKNQLGDNRKDLRKRSPISHVEKIKTPLLVMHGDQDIAVRVEQSREFVDELEDEDKVHKYVEFEDGDHYLSIQKNRTAFFEELDIFFTTYLGKREPPVTEQATTN